MPRFRQFSAVLRRFIVFTPVGAGIFFVALFILMRSLVNRNSYEIVLSCGILLLLLILGIAGFWKSLKLKSMEFGWKPPFPIVAGSGGKSMITGFEEKLPLFFRMHFIVNGRFYPSGNNARDLVKESFFGSGCFMSAETSVSKGETAAELLMDFPMSGVFNGNGFCRLKDIFGFFSFPCGLSVNRTLKVRSSPCFGKNYHINAQSGAEDKRNKTSSDEERYYMREYTPGDRFRDINWKSSDKIETLITRISPDNQEKVSRIEIFFRNYGKAEKPSLESLWLLDRAKARLTHFLRSLMEQHQSKFIFRVSSAVDLRGNNCIWEIENEHDLDVFLEDLAALSFVSPHNEITVPQGTSDMYIFSTACDIVLPVFISMCSPRPVSLFLVQPSLNNKNETETLFKKDFLINGFVPFPRWLFKNKIKQLSVFNSKIDLIYAETRL